MVATMDEYIEQLLAEMADNRTLRTVVQNILDEPIPEAVKKRLLKSLLPQPIPSPRKRKVKKQKALLQELDPLHTVTKRKLGVSPEELVPLVTAKQTLAKPPQFVLLKGAGLVKDYRAAVPIGHRLAGDAFVFLNAMMSNTPTLIEKELNQLKGQKFTQVLVAELEKLAANVQQVYDENAEPVMTRTTAYFRSEAHPILNPGDTAQKLNEANAKVMKRLGEFTDLGSGWRHRRCETLDLGVVQYRPFRGRSYIKTPSYFPPRTVVGVKIVTTAALSGLSSRHYSRSSTVNTQTAQRVSSHILAS